MTWLRCTPWVAASPSAWQLDEPSMPPGQWTLLYYKYLRGRVHVQLVHESHLKKSMRIDVIVLL